MTRNGTASGIADLHVHTAHGDGMASVAQLLAYVEAHTDLDVLAVTEHDDFHAAAEARERHAAGRYAFDLVTGMEVTTIEGHILALFIERPVPSFRSLARTLELIHDQGGLAVAPHPMNPLTRSVGHNGLQRVHHHRRAQDGVYLDGLEMESRAPAYPGLRRRTRHLNRVRWRLAEVAGSDAHFLPVVGCAVTRFPGSNAEDLRRAILSRETEAERREVPSLARIGYRTVARQQWRGIWATPRKVAAQVRRRNGR